MGDLLTRDFSQLPALVWEIIVDPASRPKEAMLVFGIIFVLLAMLFILALLLVTKRSDDEGETESGDSGLPAGELHAVRNGRPVKAPVLRGPRRTIPFAVVALVTVTLWWLATGATTAVPSVCLSCHSDSAHATTQAASDPHGSTSCIKCHETGGYAAALTISVPRRVAHIASGILADTSRGSYGYVGNSSCNSCHAAYVSKTWTDSAKAVKMSHREPLDAGAECLDCHVPRDGVVSSKTTGMQPCLRCHNDVQAPAGCSYCHTGDFALAVAGRSDPSTATARRLVPNPQCGTCHTQETCDACHGLRMPHTVEFMEYAHAREGVEDLWYNGGKTCGKCHYEGNRPCTSCHKGAFLSHGTKFRPRHGISGGAGTGCDSCHGAMAYSNNRDFCVDLCHATAKR